MITKKKEISRLTSSVHQIYFGDGTDDGKDGNDLGPPESLKSIFSSSPIFHDHLEQILNVQKKCITDGRTDGQIQFWR